MSDTIGRPGGREFQVDLLARAIGDAIIAIRPDVRLDGMIAHYPNGEASQDLREMAKRTVGLATYQV